MAKKINVVVESSNVASMDYWYKSNDLDIYFKKSKGYRYCNVPRSIFEQICEADSIGAEVNRLAVRGGISIKSLKHPQCQPDV